MMKSLKRSLVMMLAVLTLCGTLSVGASASVWRTGDFYQTKGTWTSAHTIYCAKRGEVSVTNVHVYCCDRGVGHSGSCRNKLPNQYGGIMLKLKTTAGWRYVDFVTNQWSNGYVGGIKTYGDVPIYLTMSKNRLFQHWALEGVHNVRYIS